MYKECQVNEMGDWWVVLCWYKEVAISTPPRLEHYNPIEMDRYEVDGFLAGKEKKPWTELSIKDKIASKLLIFYLMNFTSLSFKNAKIFCLFVGEIKIVQSSYTGWLKF